MAKILVIDDQAHIRTSFDVVRGLKRLYPAVKVIAITGGGALHSSGELMDACKLFGADRALPKPLDLLKLKEVMNELLQK